MGRILSLIIAAGYVAAAVSIGNGLAFRAVFLVFPLACIWFSEEVGGYSGFVGLHPVTSATPGCLIAVVGWLLLLAPAVIVAITYLHSGSLPSWCS